MIDAPRLIIYTNTPPHKRGNWTKSVDTTYTFLILNTKYPTLHEGV